MGTVFLAGPLDGVKVRVTVDESGATLTTRSGEVITRWRLTGDPLPNPRGYVFLTDAGPAKIVWCAKCNETATPWG